MAAHRCVPPLPIAARARHARATDAFHRPTATQKEKVAIIGSGNWGSAIAKIVGRNVLGTDQFEDDVHMWVFEEQVDGKNLTDIINTEHENVKYLPVRAPWWPLMQLAPRGRPSSSHSPAPHVVRAAPPRRRASSSPTT